jgi:hypothetical protein
MKGFLRTALLGALAVLVSTSMSEAYDRRLRVHNETSYDIHYLYGSNTGTSDWQEDMLGNGILPAYNTVMANMNDGTGYCKFDFRAVFSDGTEAYIWDVNTCEETDIYFTE